MTTASDIIEALDLQPLPGEGGYYRQTWILPSADGRPDGTAIIYLVTPESFSALHRLDADEVFHFYLGDPCEQLTIDPDGNINVTVLGPNVLAGELVQAVVLRRYWQGTRLVEGGNWALVGTTMAPGYHQDGFELATSNDLKEFKPDVVAAATRYLADGA